VTILYHIPYSFWSQDTAVAWATFYGIAGLKSLANYQLRSYHTHKIWCGGTDEGLSVVRPMSGLLTILLVSLLRCVKVDVRGLP